MKNNWFCVWCLLLLIAGCRSKDPEPEPQREIRLYDQVWVSYELLDMSGRPSSRFREGENFMFSLRIRNLSADTLISTRYPSPLYQFFVLVNPQVFSVVKRAADGQADRVMGRPLTGGKELPFTASSLIVMPKTTVTYQVPWQTKTGELYPMPAYDPVPDPVLQADGLSGYFRGNYLYTGSESKVDRLTQGAYYSAFTLDMFGRRVYFRTDFTVY
ncbi:hypothetical protein GCM10023187_06260 [Nibrella viscosa]|uniref:Lipoprotein n=1 Tax=Nibrella viscosa TaxID=1084524 RepID=A0ABP8JWG9_9BACT